MTDADIDTILISAMARLSTLDTADITYLLSDDDIELNKIGDEKTALFIIIPQDNESFNFLAAMMYTQLFQSLYFHAGNECRGNYVVVDKNGENTKIFPVDHSIRETEEYDSALETEELIDAASWLSKESSADKNGKDKQAVGTDDISTLMETQMMDEEEIVDTENSEDDDEDDGDGKSSRRKRKKKKQKKQKKEDPRKAEREKEKQKRLEEKRKAREERRAERKSGKKKKPKEDIQMETTIETMHKPGENMSDEDFDSGEQKQDLDPGKADEQVEKAAKEFVEMAKQAILTKRGNKYVIKVPTKESKAAKTKEEQMELAEIVAEYGSLEFARRKVEAMHNCSIRRLGLMLPYHVRFMLDEFANIGRIPDFEKKLATMRKYEISSTIILQNLNQIKTMYDKDWGSIVGNCDSFLFLGGQEIDTLEYVSKLLGAGTILAKNTSASHGGKSSNSQSIQSKKRELMTADELRRMDNSECVYILRGEPPWKDKKHQYVTHDNYKLKGDIETGTTGAVIGTDGATQTAIVQESLIRTGKQTGKTENVVTSEIDIKVDSDGTHTHSIIEGYYYTDDADDDSYEEKYTEVVSGDTMVYTIHDKSADIWECRQSAGNEAFENDLKRVISGFDVDGDPDEGTYELTGTLDGEETGKLLKKFFSSMGVNTITYNPQSIDEKNNLKKGEAELSFEFEVLGDKDAQPVLRTMSIRNLNNVPMYDRIFDISLIKISFNIGNNNAVDLPATLSTQSVDEEQYFVASNTIKTDMEATGRYSTVSAGSNSEEAATEPAAEEGDPGEPLTEDQIITDPTPASTPEPTTEPEPQASSTAPEPAQETAPAAETEPEIHYIN